MNDSGASTFSSSPSESVISSRSIACRPARPMISSSVAVRSSVAQQLAGLRRVAALHVELREREVRLAVARVELDHLLVGGDRLVELLHLHVVLGELLVRARVGRVLGERLLLPLDGFLVLALERLDLGDPRVDVALARRLGLRELEQLA